MNRQLRLTGFFSMLALAVGASTFSSAEAAKDNKPVSATMIVNAKPAYVYKAIQQIRKTNGHNLLSYDGKAAVIEELWTELPIIGSTNCVYKEMEVSDNRIDYVLVSSDKLKKFEGSWLLTPINGGKKTSVELTTTTDAGINLPFAGMLTEHSAKKRSEARVHAVAHEAEAIQASRFHVQTECERSEIVQKH